MFDVQKIREEFPVLQRTVHGKPLVYFDTAATAQRPLAVIEAIDCFYRESNANVHRGVHTLSQEATELYEGARRRLAGYLNAASEREVIFTRGTTEAINLVANSYLRPNLGPGDQILVSQMEHHANIVPWQMLRDATGAELQVIPINERGELLLDEKLGADQTLHLRHGYFACVSYADAQVGKLLDALGRFGLEENTIVVFTSDHGDCLSDHGHSQKWTMYDIITRTPVIVWAPGRFAGGQTVDTLCQQMDLGPAILELAGVPLLEIVSEPDLRSAEEASEGDDE